MLITVLTPVRLWAYWYVVRVYVIQRNRNRRDHRYYGREVTPAMRRIEDLAGRLLEWTGDCPSSRR